MRSLSHEEEYGREELVGALLGAGQFAHLTEDAIRRRLHQAAVYGGALTFSRYWGVPPVGGPARYGAGVICWLGMSGVFCCLCGRIDRPPAQGSPQLARALCPTWLSVTGPPRAEVYPWCRRCAYTLHRLCEPFSEELRAGHGRWSLGERDDMEIVLCLLLANPSFRRRVERNAANFEQLRFDPRYAPTRAGDGDAKLSSTLAPDAAHRMNQESGS